MRQIVLEEPGRFAVADVPEPTPAPGEALVRVHRIGVCGSDFHAFAGRHPMVTYPRVLGHELGVEVIDPGASGLRPGDRCAVEPYLTCGRCLACRRGRTNCCGELACLGIHVDGGMQPLFAIPPAKLHPSASLDLTQLALVETLCIGAHAVERAAIEPGDFVLIIGAGPIGLSVLQFAQLTGATLAVMDVRESRLAFCRDRFGVAHTLRPGEDTRATLIDIGGGHLPWVVIDATGSIPSMNTTFDLVAPGGRIVFVGVVAGSVQFDDGNFHRREITLCSSRNATGGTFRDVIRHIEEGRVDTRPWITHRFALADVPAIWASSIAGDQSVLKAVIEV
jgi:threonine dehydrogenase-like Zn-dependent dehydrogenase